MTAENQFAKRLIEMPERSALVVKAYVSGLRGIEFANHFGIGLPQAQCLLFRSMKDFESDETMAVADTTEMEEAAQFMASLQSMTPTGLANQLFQMTAQANETLEQSNQLARQRAHSPKYRRLEALRHWGIIGIVGIAGALYVKEHWASVLTFLERFNLSP
jgi:hypothetical protein